MMLRMGIITANPRSSRKELMKSNMAAVTASTLNLWESTFHALRIELNIIFDFKVEFKSEVLTIVFVRDSD